ncbi:MAG: hypothetical protein WBY53_07715 [Acidobacteriaceae bacterium]
MRTGSDVQFEAEGISATVIETQLRRIQESPLFSHGRRCASFLDYVVHRTLEGRQDELKERLVGVEAFGRPAEYDLNADPVVRVTASEVRKRLAQYYYDPVHQSELRIELRPGSYVPSFRFAKEMAAAEIVAEDLVVLQPVAVELAPRKPAAIGPAPVTAATLAAEGAARRWKAIAMLCGLALLVTLAIAIVPRMIRPRSALDAFWQPVTQANGPALISVGNVVAMVNNGAIAPAPFTISGHPLASDPIAVSDAQAMSTIQQVLSERSKETVLQSSTSTSFSDLQKGPDVLISGFNNPWTMRITDPLHFHFVRNSFHVYSIEDRSDPKHSWTVDTANSFEQMNYDYGLAARFRDPTTGQIVVVVAGLGENGTVAAGRFLSGEKYLSDLKKAKRFPRADQNFEAVIASQIIDGKPGPPRVVDTYTW